MPGFMANAVGVRPPVRPPATMPPVSQGIRTGPAFGGGPTQASPPPRMPPQYGGGPTSGGVIRNSNAGILSGGRTDLPGTAAYAAKYKEWMKTPEADKVFKAQANQQANFANSLNPASDMYNPDVAEKAKAAARSTDTYGQGAQGIREAMGQSMQPPTAMPPSAPGGGAPMQNIAQPPPPPTTGVNAWQAAGALRKKMPGNTGPMRPQQVF